MKNLFGLLVSLLLFSALASAQNSGYKIVDKLKIGGDGGWDYLYADPASGMLYISRGTHVQVLDMEKKAVVADIPDTKGVHGIAIATELGKGFISDGRDTAVTVFDLKTFKTTKLIKISGLNPDCIMYDAYSQRVFTFNGRSSDATAIDAVTETVVGTVPLVGKPEFAQADGKGKVFVNIEDSSLVIGFDTKSLKVVSKWSIAPGEEPSGLAIDREHGRLFSVCGNKLMVVSDYENGKVVATDSIGDGVDAAGFDPETQYAFSSNGADGTVTVIHEESPDKYKVVDTVPTAKSARTMSLDPKSHKIYLSSAEFGPKPAEATKDNPRQRPPMIPGSFTIVVLGK